MGQHDMCDGLLYPLYARGQDRSDGCEGPIRIVVAVREDRPTARLGTGLPLTVQLAGPGQLAMAIQCIQSFNTRNPRKVNVSIRSAFATSPS